MLCYIILHCIWYIVYCIHSSYIYDININDIFQQYLNLLLTSSNDVKEPSESDRSASVDLSKQPVEKLFRLLYYELMKLDRRGDERQLSFAEFSTMAQARCIHILHINILIPYVYICILYITI